jgi:hypothetical protein
MHTEPFLDALALANITISLYARRLDVDVGRADPNVAFG